jgi:hypothetical protein
MKPNTFQIKCGGTRYKVTLLEWFMCLPWVSRFFEWGYRIRLRVYEPILDEVFKTPFNGD